MAPDHFSRINGPAAINAVGIHVHDIFARHCQHVSGNEQDVAGAVVAAGELAGEGFGLASVGRLEWAKSLFSWNPVVQKERCSFRHLDLGHLKFFEIGRPRFWAAFIIRHELRVYRQRKIRIRGGYRRKPGARAVEYISWRIKLLLRDRKSTR